MRPSPGTQTKIGSEIFVTFKGYRENIARFPLTYSAVQSRPKFREAPDSPQSWRKNKSELRAILCFAENWEASGNGGSERKACDLLAPAAMNSRDRSDELKRSKRQPETPKAASPSFAHVDHMLITC